MPEPSINESVKSSHEHLLSKVESLLNQDVTVDKPLVAACGLMNAGKSFLLNMLTNNIQQEYFRTNDIRETTELKSFRTEDFVFLDTPGLDANNEDDLAADEGAAKADIILFVHQPQGELEKVEIDYLRSLKDSFGEFAEKNIILVLSKSDNGAPDDIAAIKQRMLEQCKDGLGFIPRCFAISGTSFKVGVTRKSDELVAKSCLYDLARHLGSLSSEVRAVKRERQMIAINMLKDEFKQAEEALYKRQCQALQKLQAGLAPFDKAMDDFYAWIKPHQRIKVF
ncbi:50S ribosome-binding GTPase [Escherichia coli]|uniref:50S ribosome-binding GTPase n=1 Tax=Escherichia coli TaxID=562 RepID=A0A2X6FYR4_ECOLX|nr:MULTISPECIES: GTPase [Escherichia]EGB0884705.1 hypothetical protein [Escherichia coli]EGF1715930.1 hypothetical protein [Escherichia coli]QMF66340.1 50S ribosome-binding GTPase [Escherichia coli]QMF71534.1 50S ribosome-binding GTPase [Escherichia coli]QMG96857.1 50S ribosome-binding GTPase [Escherichia coli]